MLSEKIQKKKRFLQYFKTSAYSIDASTAIPRSQKSMPSLRGYFLMLSQCHNRTAQAKMFSRWEKGAHVTGPCFQKSFSIWLIYFKKIVLTLNHEMNGEAKPNHSRAPCWSLNYYKSTWWLGHRIWLSLYMYDLSHVCQGWRRVRVLLHCVLPSNPASDTAWSCPCCPRRIWSSPCSADRKTHFLISQVVTACAGQQRPICCSLPNESWLLGEDASAQSWCWWHKFDAVW